MAELTVREGDGDAERTGYWVVIGPQDEHDMYAIVERSRITPDDGQTYVGFRWYLHERTRSEFNSVATYMDTINRGEGATLEEAIEQLREAWPAMPYVTPEPVTERMQRLVPRTDI